MAVKVSYEFAGDVAVADRTKTFAADSVSPDCEAPGQWRLEKEGKFVAYVPQAILAIEIVADEK